MISKKWYVCGKMILSVALSTQLFSCSEFLRGKPEKKTTIEVNKESLSCLKGVAAQFKTLLTSAASVNDVDQSFACLDQTLNEFQNRVEGRAEATSFTADELFTIFKQFIEDAQISQAATTDLLILKAAILGGSEQKITKKEIADLRNFLMALKPEIKSLLPYAKVFTFKKGSEAFSQNLIRDAFVQLNVSLKNLLKITNVTRSDYQFEDLKRLIMNLKLVEGENKNLVELADKVKNLLVGKYVLQSETDYFLFVDNLTEVLRLYAIQVQGTVKFEISTSANMTAAIDYIEGWLNLLEHSVQYKNKQMISVESANPLIEEIAKLNILPVKITGPTLVSFYKMLLARVFDSGREGDVNKLTGITQLHFVNIKREVAIYRLYMKFIDQAAAMANQRKPIKDLQLEISRFNPVDQQDILKVFDKPEQTKILRAFEELRAEFMSKRPVVYRFKKMVIAANQDIWDQNWEDLARSFYSKMLARELLLGWGIIPSTKENPAGAPAKEVSQAYMTEEGLIQWYAEFKDFGIESKAFDPRSANSGSESFKQADLLTFSANGDNKMGYLESVQYVNMLVSGGGQTLAEMRDGFAKANCNLSGKPDAFEYAWNNEECAVKELKRNFKYYFSNLSWLNAYVEKLNDEQFREFYYELMEVTRFDKVYKGQKIETADLRAMSIILHYIESMYAIYDKDGNSTFSASEIRVAYAERFKPFAKQYANDNARAQIDEFNGALARIAYACYNEEDLVRESFIFLIYTGRTPSKSDLTTLPCVWGFEKPLIDFSVHPEVNRKTIISTFKILKAVLGSKK